MIEHSLISIIDDDISVRESLPDLLRELGYVAEAFSSGEEFLASRSFGRTACLIVDVSMPGISGPDLQRELRRREDKTPIIFITARTDETIRGRVLQEGAAGYLSKPFNDHELLKALSRAFGAAEAFQRPSQPRLTFAAPHHPTDQY